ncbi:tRNA glutamyl-Q(34) synthetase GluQRS [Alloalcanivorax sp. C16-2]|uniref:tRNA glutamyl-Q(34) synthetase GluQRS n=1 Tax=Alloalcanivorax sp. C16-2 TaxID=3390052 RepID=UPI003971147C
MKRAYVGRFAPTPSGPLHFGSLVTALASWLDARHHGGRWLLRVDDLDPPRQQPGAVDTILHQLDRFGLHWDGAPLHQSRRADAYDAAVERLLAGKQAFYCTLSRKQLQALDNVHPGPAAAQPPGPDRAVRLTVPDAERCFEDRLQGRVCANLAREGGPFVIRRRDGLFAYQLACALDDADQGITDVVRGSDLLASTLRQLRVLECLAAPPPRYAHLPVIMDPTGGKMSKSAGAAALDPDHPAPALFAALACVGLAPEPALGRAGIDEQLAWARAHWRPALLPGGRRQPPPAFLRTERD